MGLDERALCTAGGQVEVGLNNRGWVYKGVNPYYENAEAITGEYIIDGYENNKNSWHYVKIKAINAAEGVYQWTNSAGVSWTLTQKTDIKS